MNNKYIGVFDSGLGGLTAVKNLIKVLPNENIIYFGDTARVPYGSRSEETLIKYVKSDISFLQKFDIKMILVACGTASTVALPKLKDNINIPIFGVVEPVVKKAVDVTKNGKIGVLGTASTINSNKYEQYIKKLSPQIEVYNKACPLFVPLVENGYADSEAAHLIASDYLKDIIKSGADTIILGCTHYPILKKVIGNIVGENVTLVDSGRELAEYAKIKLAEQNSLCGCPKSQQYRYFVSDNIDGFTHQANIFLGRHIDGDIQKINIELYN